MGNICCTNKDFDKNDIIANASMKRHDFRLEIDLDSPTNSLEKVIEENDQPSFTQKKFSCMANFETKGGFTIENGNNEFENYIFNQTEQSLETLFKAEAKKQDDTANNISKISEVSTRFEDNNSVKPTNNMEATNLANIESVSSDYSFNHLCKSHRRYSLCVCSTCGSKICY